jgi:hypothetical protein
MKILIKQNYSSLEMLVSGVCGGGCRERGDRQRMGGGMKEIKEKYFNVDTSKVDKSLGCLILSRKYLGCFVLNIS